MKPLKIIKAGIKYIFNPDYRFLVNAGLGIYDNMPDDEYLKRKFKAKMGYELDLQNPKTFNEKLQWLKLYDRKPIYTTMVDKYAARKYVSDIIGEEYLIPLLGVWDNPDEIDFDKLPNQFVLKCNHNSGKGLCICKDKSKLDIEKVKRELKKGLAENYYLSGREWPYKDVKRKIVAEKYMEDIQTEELRDYKFFCFNGNVEYVFIASDRQNETEETKFDFFDKYGKHLQLINGHPTAKTPPELPEKFEKMKKLAEVLSNGIPHIRVDFYETNGKIYFGELTLFHWSGLVPFKPNDWDLKFGGYIKLP